MYPPGYPPPPYSPPISIKVLGIINLVFTALGVIGLLFTYGMYFGGMRMGPRNPVVELAHATPAYMSFLKWSIVFGAIALVTLAVCGIGLLRMKAWGRKLAIGYALYSVVASIVGLVVTYHYLLGPLSRSRDATAGAGAMGGMMGGILSVVYPVILLVFMLRKPVIEAFERANQPPLPPARVV